MIMNILSQVTAFTGCTTAEATMVVKAIEAGMDVVAALGIVFGAGVSGILANTIKRAVMRNAGKAIIAMGLLTFSVLTVALLMTNGFSLGYMIASNYIANTPIRSIALAILPHGVLEITGLLIAGVIGLNGIKFYFDNDKISNLKENLKLFLLGSIFILIAAIIEGTVTPILLKK